MGLEIIGSKVKQVTSHLPGVDDIKNYEITAKTAARVAMSLYEGITIAAAFVLLPQEIAIGASIVSFVMASVVFYKANELVSKMHLANNMHLFLWVFDASSWTQRKCGEMKNKCIDITARVKEKMPSIPNPIGKFWKKKGDILIGTAKEMRPLNEAFPLFEEKEEETHEATHEAIQITAKFLPLDEPYDEKKVPESPIDDSDIKDKEPQSPRRGRAKEPSRSSRNRSPRARSSSVGAVERSKTTKTRRWPSFFKKKNPAQKAEANLKKAQNLGSEIEKRINQLRNNANKEQDETLSKLLRGKSDNLSEEMQQQIKIAENETTIAIEQLEMGNEQEAASAAATVEEAKNELQRILKQIKGTKTQSMSAVPV